ncbi:NOL1/NOP2/fmu family ribosome biogenesis protein [Wenyingzhuangia heitensis]|uniref:NOL1/NOP2/fmu family ribosome biogenesis protein n=1 Tax=Wenyingzhuangia heitensis TaxID=1487859 RepID=A0ABX0UBY7_9FLAO|nr:hypothetical protein [Wenyingzhuangia heitensis]NIJ46350.1 NOL1/NOP2/fmu family ribosome biogenesis protein [Wenyingzhuangia heitensis]
MKTQKQYLKRVITTVLALATFSFASAQKDKVSFANRTASVENAKPLTFEVNYKASEDREINIELKDFKQNKWIAGKTVKVEKGEGTTKVKVNTKGQFEDGSNYTVILTIRPVGSTWKETISKDELKPFAIGNDVNNGVITEDKVSFIEGTGKLTNPKLLTFEVKYAATTDREISLELKNAKTNKWVAGRIVKINKGAATTTIKVFQKEGFEKGDDYMVNVSIRPTGSTWKETINRETIKPFSIK